jgi:hypothetical protein
VIIAIGYAPLAGVLVMDTRESWAGVLVGAAAAAVTLEILAWINLSEEFLTVRKLSSYGRA